MLNSSIKSLSATILMSLLAVTVTHAQQEITDAEGEGKKLEQAIDEAGEGGESEGSQVGEASYNVEDCRALIESEGEHQGDGDSTTPEAGNKPKKLDLDKCRALIK